MSVVEKSPSSASNAAPVAPSARPIQLVTGTRSPPQRVHSASHIGMVVTTVAMRPDPMPSFCATTIRLIAAKAMSVPMSALARHWAPVGQASPCQRAIASMSKPASRKRTPFMSNGGSACIATSSAK
jgi:hypothetical protein